MLGATNTAPSTLAQRLIPHSYERWLPPRAPGVTELEVMRAVQHFGRAHRLHLVHDPRLDVAATHLLPWAQAHAGATLPFDALQRCVWQMGDTDADLAALALGANSNERLGLSVQKALAQTLPHLTANRFGVAQDHTTVVVAFASHWMHLAPTPSQVASGQSIRVAGQNVDRRIDTVTLAVSRPDGSLAHTRPLLRNAAFAEVIDVGQRPGVLDVQILIDRGQGPQIAAQYPVGVGQSPWPQIDPSQEAQRIKARPQGSLRAAALTHAQREAAKKALVALVWGLRRAHSLRLPEPLQTLMTAAQRHSDDMGLHHFFAHVSQRTGDVTQRLATLRQPYSRVVENIAAAENLDGGFAQWTHSPSHRANLLDPSVTHIGVGISGGDAPDDVLMVLVMAHIATTDEASQ